MPDRIEDFDFYSHKLPSFSQVININKNYYFCFFFPFSIIASFKLFVNLDWILII